MNHQAHRQDIQRFRQWIRYLAHDKVGLGPVEWLSFGVNVKLCNAKIGQVTIDYFLILPKLKFVITSYNHVYTCFTRVSLVDLRYAAVSCILKKMAKGLVEPWSEILFHKCSTFLLGADIGLIWAMMGYAIQLRYFVRPMTDVTFDVAMDGEKPRWSWFLTPWDTNHLVIHWSRLIMIIRLSNTLSGSTVVHLVKVGQLFSGRSHVEQVEF